MRLNYIFYLQYRGKSDLTFLVKDRKWHSVHYIKILEGNRVCRNRVWVGQISQLLQFT